MTRIAPIKPIRPHGWTAGVGDSRRTERESAPKRLEETLETMLNMPYGLGRYPDSRYHTIAVLPEADIFHVSWSGALEHSAERFLMAPS